MDGANGVVGRSLKPRAGGRDERWFGNIEITCAINFVYHYYPRSVHYYGIHLPGIPEEEPVAREVAREIEATYPGYQPIPPDIGNEIVPDVDMYGATFGEATIYTALFSGVWTWIQPADVQREVHRRASM